MERGGEGERGGGGGGGGLGVVWYKAQEVEENGRLVAEG